ncbi:hypothetical protein [Desulfoluna butyratoxydans]|uniref:hypothetical protein n=1 Tax=Desulfoluna butyratoxydans TaxID=231438 RepID=UPI0015D35750|nr:hypothetical protein [Desulfoluna butyratoxydans]
MDISKALYNFRNAIDSIWDNLRVANISPGDDEWDDITETLFANLVCIPLDKDFGRYAFYNEETKSKIILVIPHDAKVLIGTNDKSDNGLSNMIEWKTDKFNDDNEFVFREFANPSEPYSKTSLSFVTGQCLKTGLIISVPYRNVSFKITEI